MPIRIQVLWVLIACWLCAGGVQAGENARQPNLLIIQTDEHNFRTLGCYREQLIEEQGHIWGPGVRVETPNIDSIARDGAICTNYYAASPLCTPSRASFVSGLYPQATGSYGNNIPLNDDVVTFAQVLKRHGYATAYVGKWHLDGDAKPGWAPARKFGFDDNRYMFNRGHWKMLEQTEGGAQIIGEYDVDENRYIYDISDSTEASFTTDFLTQRTLEIIARDKDRPFCIMLALPDPHGPNTVRAPYDTMYKDLVFEVPVTMRATLADPGQSPEWSRARHIKNTKALDHDLMQNYFGMVKCIDDNVGKILRYLESSGLAENTIVVFTSDHGDMLYEHLRHNKAVPYETSAKIPFLIRYPGAINAGQVVKTPYTTVDFAPTILSLMGIESDLPEFHGKNCESELVAEESVVSDERVIYFRSAHDRWVAAVDGRYKLVLSTTDKPWLFDLHSDPNELINYYEDPAYAEIATHMQAELFELMDRYDEPVRRELLVLSE